MMYRPFSLALLLPALVACGGQALDVGSNEGGADGAGATTGAGASDGAGNTGTGGVAGQPQGLDPGVGAHGNVTGPMCEQEPVPGPPLPAWPARDDCQEGSSALQGTWAGYVQGTGPYPDNGNFTINLKGDDKTLCGTITFGPSAELAPATDPDAYYPPDFEMDKGIDVVPGYAYQLSNVSLSGQRLQLGLLIAEPMRSWCQLQTPYFDGITGATWNCQRPLGTGHTYDPEPRCTQWDDCTKEEHVVSCAQIGICSNPARPCVCDESGCDGNTEPLDQHTFDLRFEGDEATGQLEDGNVYLVYLTRE